MVAGDVVADLDVLRSHAEDEIGDVAEVGGGFDLTESTLDAIQNDTVTFTVGQDPYSQGFQSVMLGWEYVERGIPMKDDITGVSVIDESTIDFASQRSGSWADLVEYQNANY